MEARKSSKKGAGAKSGKPIKFPFQKKDAAAGSGGKGGGKKHSKHSKGEQQAAQPRDEDDEQEYGSIDKHRSELESLKEKDPEFFAYLNEHDEGLLAFGDGEEDDEDQLMEEINAAGEGEGDDEEADIRRQGPEELTLEMFEGCQAKALSGNWKELRKLYAMFRAACQPPRDPQQGDDSDDEGADASARYVISDAEVFQEVMAAAAQALHQAFALHLELDLQTCRREQLGSLGEHKLWRKLQPLVLGAVKLLLALLASVALLPKHAQMAGFLLSALQHYLPLLSPLPRMAKAAVKVLLTVWAAPGSETHDTHLLAQRLREQAFRCVLRLAQCAPGAIAEDCFRAAYLKFARRCRAMSEYTSSVVLFWMQTLVTLYRSDISLAYQQAFLYIRQLALHVRTAYVRKGEAVLRPLRSWQFLNCLRAWTQLICAEPSSERGLGMLAYPLAQTMLAVSALLPSTYYSPMRIHLASALQQLAAHCHMFMPCALPLCEMLAYDELFDKPAPSTEAAPKLQVLLALPSNSLNRPAVRDALLQQVVQMLYIEAEVYRYHAGCAEYFYLPLKKLRAFSKRAKSAKWRDTARGLIARFQDYAQHCKTERSKRGLTPMTALAFEALKPAGTPSAAQRIAPLLASNLLPPSLPSKSKQREHRKQDRDDDDEDSNASDQSDDDDSDDDSDDDDDDEEEEEGNKRGKGKRPAPKAQAPRQQQQKSKKPRKQQRQPNPNHRLRDAEELAGERDVVQAFSWKDAKHF